MSNFKICAVLALLVCGAVVLRADTSTNVASVPQPGQFTIRDYRLLARAVHGNEMEFIFGQIGNEKSTDSTVRAFTQHILDDHRKTDDALTKLIKSKSATAPQAVDVADTTVLRQLNAVSGSDFDRRYMAAMVREYQTAVQDLQNVSANANDSELRAWAVQTLPVWQEHLQMAQNTDATVTGDM